MTTAIQAIFVRGYEERTDPKPHWVYRIEVQASVRSWFVWKRYSEFDALHAALSKLPLPSGVSGLPASLPPKNSLSMSRFGFGGKSGDAKTLEERRAGLETYLRAILSAKEEVWRESSPWKDFLGVPSSRSAPSGSGAGGAGLVGADPNAFTPATWLDEHTDVQSRLRDVWADINKRDALNTSGDLAASLKANLTAKSKLAGVLSRIGVLEKALGPLARGGMSEGELQRRTDMASRLRDDCERLSRVVMAARQAARAATVDTSTGVGSGGRGSGAIAESDRAALLGNHSFTRKNTVGARRVFGASSPPQETETTRPLDNQGLYGLQQEQIVTQNTQLSQLTTILQRQRQLGEAIGAEVAQHIEMLDDLNNEVDRVGGKLTSTKKKMDRLR